MASVRITDSIRSHVQSTLNSMQNQRVRTQREKFDTSLGEKAVRQHLKDHLSAPLIEKLERETQMTWINRRKDFRLRAMNGSIMLETIEKIPVPVNYAGVYTPPTIEITQEEFPELFNHMEGIFKRCQAIEAEYTKLRETLVQGVLRKCTTLRQVLELWPSAIDFMPSEAVAKHREKTVKRSRKDIVSEIEVDDSIKASLAKERMINGSQ